MAKIVIIAPAGAEDVDDAVKLLKAAGHDVETEEPTPKSLLHIVLGLLGPNAYGFGAGYAYQPGAQADDVEDELPDAEPPADDPLAADAAELPADDEISFDAAEDDFNFEDTSVDGESLNAIRVDSDHSTLIVEKLTVGPKTTYQLNESSFSFWPADQARPMQRVDVRHKKFSTSLEVEIQEGDKQELRVGRDLTPLFEVEKALHDKLDELADGADEVEHKGKKYRRSGPKNSTGRAGKWKEVKTSETK